MFNTKAIEKQEQLNVLRWHIFGNYRCTFISSGLDVEAQNKANN